MSIENHPETNVIIPSSPADRQKIKLMITEMTHCMQRIADERSALKDITDEVSKQFNIPKKHVTKLAKTWFKRDFANVRAEQEDFETLYETILEKQSSEG